jgi:hypothetical protein
MAPLLVSAGDRIVAAAAWTDVVELLNVLPRC